MCDGTGRKIREGTSGICEQCDQPAEKLRVVTDDLDQIRRVCDNYYTIIYTLPKDGSGEAK